MISREELILWSEIDDAIRDKIGKITPIICACEKYRSADNIPPRYYQISSDRKTVIGGYSVYEDDAYMSEYTCTFPTDYLFMSEYELENEIDRVRKEESDIEKKRAERRAKEKKEREYQEYQRLKEIFDCNN